MNNIFLIFVSLSLSGTLIALLLFFLKPIIKNRLSKTWQYYIFLVVVIRFLFPFGPDTNLMGMIFNRVVDYVGVNDNSTDTSNRNNFLLFPSEVQQEQVNNNVVNSPSSETNIWETLYVWLWFVWIIPTALLLFLKIANYYRYTRFVKNGCEYIENDRLFNIYREICKARGIKHVPRLATNEQLASPMLVGVFQPVIVLPDTKLNDADIGYVFQHELTHYKRMDIVYKWLVQVALCFHWYNPFAYWISREVNRNCELSCDETVIKHLDEKGKYAYGNMLLDAIKFSKVAPHPTVSLTMSEDTKLIKERLKAIMTHKKQSRKLIIFSILLTVCLLCCAVFVGSYTLKGSNSMTPTVNGSEVQVKSDPLAALEAPAIIEEMKLRYYEDVDPAYRWPYLHWIISNNSNKTINDYEMVCLAYDKDGTPLKLDWYLYGLTDGNQITGYTNQSEKFFENIITLTKPIPSGGKEDLNGGWSLHDGWNQADGTHQVVYVLACMKQITFDDGTIWKNPKYKDWLSSYKGKSVAIDTLKAYYTKHTN